MTYIRCEELEKPTRLTVVYPQELCQRIAFPKSDSYQILMAENRITGQLLKYNFVILKVIQNTKLYFYLELQRKRRNKGGFPRPRVILFLHCLSLVNHLAWPDRFPGQEREANWLPALAPNSRPLHLSLSLSQLPLRWRRQSGSRDRPGHRVRHNPDPLALPQHSL
jgi:hypothetical protein